MEQLRTLIQVSKTEQDLDASAADDALDELTSDDAGEGSDATGSDDDLDESLVDSIEEYVSADDSAADVVADADDDDADDDQLSYDFFDDVDDAPEAEADDVAGADEADDIASEAEIDDDGDEPSESAVDADMLEDDDFADDDDDADDEIFEVPTIVMATESDDDLIEPVEGVVSPVEPDVSDDILEELRRADIDGPIVEMAPQDDTTSARRRPKRAIDYDPAPVPIPLKVPRILGRKPRVRKVTRVVRHVDPWSVFKIAIIANLVLYGIVMTASVLLWNVAYATGTVQNVERFFESFGWQSFEFNGGELYHSAWIAGLFVAVGLTGLAVLMATLFNLITDLVGGIRFTVLEEEVVESRTSPMRRFVVRRPEPDIPAVISDPSGSIIREAVVDDTGDIPR